jgi:hypothetical protein
MVASEGLGAGRSRPGGFAEGPFQPLNASNDTWTESRFRGLGGLISFHVSQQSGRQSVGAAGEPREVTRESERNPREDVSISYSPICL